MRLLLFGMPGSSEGAIDMCGVVHVSEIGTCFSVFYLNGLRSCILPVGLQSYRPSIFPFRLPDVRATEIDKVVMSDCFRPGDIVRAMVLSLGDSRSYYLTTAKNELGVVYAKAAVSGMPLVPISWEEMQDPETHAVERRKIAKTV